VHVGAPAEGVELRGHFAVEPLQGASACTDFHGVSTGVGTNVTLLSYSMSAAPDDLAACEAQLPRARAAFRDLVFDGVFFGFSAVARRYRCRLCEDGCEGGVACVVPSARQD
jgi:hypothetical protein